MREPSQDYNTTLNYLLESALDDLEMESQEYILSKEETEQIEEYVHDNDCDIINELIDCMKEQIREQIDEIIENRRKVYNVCFNISCDVNLEIEAQGEEQIDMLCDSGAFKRFILDYLDAYTVDLDIDHSDEIEYTEWVDCKAEDYL